MRWNLYIVKFENHLNVFHFDLAVCKRELIFVLEKNLLVDVCVAPI